MNKADVNYFIYIDVKKCINILKTYTKTFLMELFILYTMFIKKRSY